MNYFDVVRGDVLKISNRIGGFNTKFFYILSGNFINYLSLRRVESHGGKFSYSLRIKLLGFPISRGSNG